MKSAETLASFAAYCTEHPEQRFWQALCNWSGQNAIYALQRGTVFDVMDLTDKTAVHLVDTYQWNDKSGESEALITREEYERMVGLLPKGGK